MSEISSGTATAGQDPAAEARTTAFKNFKSFKTKQGVKKLSVAAVGAVATVGLTSLTASNVGGTNFPQLIENGACSAAGGNANGNSLKPNIVQLNVLKNRTQAPDEDDIDAGISSDTFVNGPMTDINSGAGAGFDQSKGADVTAYVVEVKSGGAETCNCQTTDQQWWDTHIYLSPVPGVTDKSKCFIVEVTPRFRLNGSGTLVNQTTQQLEASLPVGTKVEVTGWQFYDSEHILNSENNPNHAKSVWRATCWEIHPVTDIKVLSGQDSSTDVTLPSG